MNYEPQVYKAANQALEEGVLLIGESHHCDEHTELEMRIISEILFLNPSGQLGVGLEHLTNNRILSQIAAEYKSYVESGMPIFRSSALLLELISSFEDGGLVKPIALSMQDSYRQKDDVRNEYMAQQIAKVRREEDIVVAAIIGALELNPVTELLESNYGIIAAQYDLREVQPPENTPINDTLVPQERS